MPNSQLLLCYGFLILFNAVFFVALSALPYVAKSVELPDLELGYAQTVFNVLQLIGGPFVGYLVDVLGFRSTLAVNYVAMGCFSFVLYNAESGWAIGLSQILGLVMVAQQTIQTAVAHLTKAGSERTTAFSRLGLCFGVGFVLTPIIAKVASMVGGERGPLAAVSVVSFAAVPLILISVRDLGSTTESETEQIVEGSQSTIKSSGWKLIFTDVKIRRLLILKILLLAPSFLIFGSMQIFMMNKFAVDQATNALVQLDVGISIVFSNTLGITYFRRRFTEEELLNIGAFISIFCFAQFLWVESLVQIWIGVFCLIFTTTISGSSSDSLISSSVEQEQQGLVLGLSNSLISLIRTTAPTFALWAADRLGYGILGWMGIGCALVAIAIQRISPLPTDQSARLKTI